MCHPFPLALEGLKFIEIYIDGEKVACTKKKKKPKDLKQKMQKQILEVSNPFLRRQFVFCKF